jgi:hypothetical protein
MPLVRCLIGVMLCFYSSFSTATELRPYVVNVQASTVERGYYAKLLALVLNASKAPDEVIQIRFAHAQLSQARWIAVVAQGTDNNVIWTMTNKAREETLRPIRFPLTKGLMGYRVLVIREEDAARFATIKTRQDLQAYNAGQGAHWPDKDILRENSFRIVEAMTKENLYKMLSVKRFDFFPRGITEIALERNLMTGQGLIVEPNLLLHYPTDLYFFVNKQNEELARRIEKGWAIVLKNGEFEKLFSSIDSMKVATDFINTHKYRVIELENPFLSEETRKASEPYWLNVETRASH